MPDPSFGVFILTHGRPDRVVTIPSLRKCGYTGPIWLVIDNEDERGDEYRERFGEEMVVEFDKAAIAATFDAADLSEDRRTIVYARNATDAIARSLGLDYYLQLDDDYTSFRYRWFGPGNHSRYWTNAGGVTVPDFDRLVRVMLDFMEDTGALTVAFAQGGEYIGGASSHIAKVRCKRKAMNSFFVRTGRPIPFLGRINEDVNAYTLWGSRGELFLTVFQACLTQTQTQGQAGGMTEAYLDLGTYVKSFYTVMMCPSFVHVRSLGLTDRRFHHHILWDHAVPKIVPGSLARD